MWIEGTGVIIPQVDVQVQTPSPSHFSPIADLPIHRPSTSYSSSKVYFHPIVNHLQLGDSTQPFVCVSYCPLVSSAHPRTLERFICSSHLSTIHLFHWKLDARSKHWVMRRVTASSIALAVPMPIVRQKWWYRHEPSKLHAHLTQSHKGYSDILNVREMWLQRHSMNASAEKKDESLCKRSRTSQITGYSWRSNIHQYDGTDEATWSRSCKIRRVTGDSLLLKKYCMWHIARILNIIENGISYLC